MAGATASCAGKPLRALKTKSTATPFVPVPPIHLQVARSLSRTWWQRPRCKPAKTRDWKYRNGQPVLLGSASIFSNASM